MKKIFAIVMSVLMIACFVPTMAFAEEYSSDYAVYDLATVTDSSITITETKAVLKGASSKNVEVTIQNADFSELILDNATGIKSIKMEYRSNVSRNEDGDADENCGISFKLKGENKVRELVEIKDGSIIITGEDANASLTVGSQNNCLTSDGQGLNALWVVINSGNITAYGSDARAAIGGSEWIGVGVAINDGTVNATTGGWAAAIGAGKQSDSEINITGGDVTAATSWQGAAIGGSYGGSATVTISGGTVNATATSSGAAIGGGNGERGSVTISGGTVNAKTTGTGAAIGSGYESSSGGYVWIKGGEVTAVAGYYGAAIGGGSKSDGKVIISSGIVDAKTTGIGAAIGGGNGANGGGYVWIKDGTVTATSSGGYALGCGETASGDGQIEVDDGTVTLINTKNKLVGKRENLNCTSGRWFYGGTFNFDPSDLLEEGYKAVKGTSDTWTIEKEKYTVTFNSLGGSTVDSETVEYKGAATKPNNPTRTGYTFAGWYKDADCREAWDFENDTVEKETTLYAKWTINKYTVTFNSLGGSAVDSQKVEYNGSVEKPADPTRDGYTFNGWYKGNETTAVDWGTGITVTEDMTLTAHWTKEGSGKTETSTTVSTDKESGTTTTTTTETVTEKDAGGQEVTTTTKTKVEEKVETIDNATVKTTTETVTVNNEVTAEKKTEVKTEAVTEDDGATTGTKETTTETVTKGGTGSETETKVTVVENKTKKTENGSIDIETTTVTSGNTTTEIKKEQTKDADGEVTKTVSTEIETVETENKAVTTSEATVTTEENKNTTVKTIKNTKDTVNKVTTAAEVETVTKQNGEKVNTTKVTAEITEEKGNALPSTINIDATKATKDKTEVAAAEVTLPNTTVTTLKDAAKSTTEREQVKTVAVTTDVATLKIDNTALQTLTKDAGSEEDGKSLVLKVEKTDSTVGQTGNAQATFELSAVLRSDKDETETKVFNDTTKQNGTIAVSVNYEKKYSRSYLTVYYVDGEGNRTAMPTNYNGDILTWTTTHFSEFEVVETVRSSGGYVAPTTDDTKKDDAATDTKTDEQVKEENAAKAASLTQALTLKARSAKTKAGNIKVTLTVDKDAIKAIEDLGYTVKYKFYRSTKKAASYKAALEKTGKTYTNTSGKKGTKYYYKARVMVYDAQGALVTKSELKQCKYACRIK